MEEKDYNFDYNFEKHANRFFGFCFSIPALYFGALYFEVDWAIDFSNNYLSSLKPHILFIVIPGLLASKCFNNAERLKKKIKNKMK